MDDDPFSDDEAAKERERRRREREARRAAAGAPALGSEGGGIESLADRVRALLDGEESDDEQVAAADQTDPETPADHGEPETRPRTSSEAVIWRRRMLAAGGLLITLVVLALIVQGLSGGEAESASEPVAAEKEITVAVPEGLTIQQVADSKPLEQAQLKGNYVKEARSFKGFDAAGYNDGNKPPSLEGFLFPATYNLFEGSTVRDLIERQLAAFEERITSVDMKRAKRGNLTVYDVLIIASMIEREVSVDSERKLVASVIYNRLSAGQPLGIDATLRYDLEKYDGQLTESDLATESPYNTRLVAGLPPTPIASPGLASIEAAAKPADTDFLYYVIEPGTCNEHFFTDSIDEFNAAVDRYQQALAEAGGSPTDCSK